MGKFPLLLAPPDAESDWQVANLDSNALQTYSPARLLELLADLSPDISRALWDFLRLCNPGYTCQARKPGTEDADPKGQQALSTFIDVLNDRYGSFDVVIGRLFTSAWLRGAFFAELVLDARGRVPLDLATPDPATVRFRRVTDPDIGSHFELGQWQFGTFTVLDRPTVRYLPVDPFPGSPYGRPLAAPALFSTLFLIGLLHDLRRVVSQQGYPRIDITILSEALKGLVSPDVQNDPVLWNEVVSGAISQVQTVYRSLQPDDAYVHTEGITVGRPVGTVDASSLGAIGPLVEALERWAMRALKTMPLLMGIPEGMSEGNSTRQWEIMAAGVKSIQHYAETLLERLLELSLQAQGIQAEVSFRFAELRAAEMKRDADTEVILIQNAARRVMLGFETLDAACLRITGHDIPKGIIPPDPTAIETIAIGRPITHTPADAAVADNTGNADGGAMRSLRRRATDGTVTPKGAGLPLPALPEHVTYSSADKRKVLGSWDASMDAEYHGLLDAEVVTNGKAD